MREKYPALLLPMFITLFLANGCRRGGTMPYEPELGIVQITMDPQFEHYPTWSGDGLRIAFVCQRSENINVYWTTLTGSDIHRVTSETGYALTPEWSENDFIVYELGGNLRLTRSHGGASMTIYHLGGAYSPTCSPDCNTIAFEKEGRIYLLSRANGTVQYLTDGFQPAWSPYVNKIAFVAQYSGNLDIGVISLHDHVVERLTVDHDYDVEPCWSPDGSKIAFTSNRGGNDDIWVVSAFGGVPIQVTSDSSYDGSAAWSPDGRKIAFMSRRSGPGDFIAYDTPPRPKEIVEPYYPDVAIADSIEGTVILQLQVFNDGMVGDIKIVRSLDPRESSCDDAAVAAARLTRFYPAMQRNIPVTVWVSYGVRFELRDSGANASPDFSRMKVDNNGRLAGGDGDIWVVDAP